MVRRLHALALTALVVGAAPLAVADDGDDGERVAALIARLGSAEDADRHAARDGLRALGRRAVPGLVRYVEEMSVGLRARVARLIEQLADRSWKRRERASRELKLVGPAALDALAVATKSETPEIRWRARLIARAIRDTDGEREEERKRRYLGSIRLLSELGDERATATLLRELESDNPAVPPLAAFGLGRIGDPRSVPALAERVRDPRWPVRVHAVWALGRCGDAGGLPALRAVANDAAVGPYLRSRAVGAVGRVVAAMAKAGAGAGQPDRELGGWLIDWLEDDAWELRAASIGALQALTGDDRGYRYEQTAEQRAKALVAWRAWAAALPRPAGDGK